MIVARMNGKLVSKDVQRQMQWELAILNIHSFIINKSQRNITPRVAAVHIAHVRNRKLRLQNGFLPTSRGARVKDIFSKPPMNVSQIIYQVDIYT